MRAFADGGRPEVRAATKRPVGRRRKKPGPERFFSPHDFEALILTPGLTGLRVSGGQFSAGGSQSARRRPLRSPSGLRSAGALPNLGGPVFNRQKWPSFQPALTDVFAAEPENRIAREERGGGKTSVVGSPM